MNDVHFPQCRGQYLLTETARRYKNITLNSIALATSVESGKRLFVCSWHPVRFCNQCVPCDILKTIRSGSARLYLAKEYLPALVFLKYLYTLHFIGCAGASIHADDAMFRPCFLQNIHHLMMVCKHDK